MRKFRVPLIDKPKKEYKLHITNTDVDVKVEPTSIPYTRHGLPGSVLDIISSIDENLIDHACGGVQACSTCHIYVKSGSASTNEVSEREQDYIDKARGSKLNSRLACCCVADGTLDLEIEIPKWNINVIKEGKNI